MNNQEVVLKNLPQRKVVYLLCRGRWCQLPNMITKLSEYTSQSRIETVGPPSGFYYNTLQEVAVEDLTWEVCYPVDPNTPEYADDKLKSGVREIPTTKVAAIVHEGPYRKTSPSYDKLQTWIETQRLKVCGPAEELYLTDVGTINKEQRIEIRLPVCQA